MEIAQTSIFEEIKNAGIEYDNHYSDLYIPVNEKTKEILSRYPGHCAGMFTNRLNGQQWYDIPFSYLPYWEKKLKSRKTIKGW